MRTRQSPLLQALIENWVWSDSTPEMRELSAALRLHRKAVLLGRLGRLWSSLTRSDRNLVVLNALEGNGPLKGWRYVGLQEVPISQIVGSDKRCEDFDRDYYPLPSHDPSRWLNIALTQQMGMPQPPIDVIQVGTMFFVQSGHYHISVARAMGHQVMKAYVTRWVVANKNRRRNMLADHQIRRALKSLMLLVEPPIFIRNRILERAKFWNLITRLRVLIYSMIPLRGGGTTRQG
jgi:hypothetical protein